MRPLLMLGAMALLAGCASAPRERHYTLSATAAGAPVASMPGTAIAVGLARVNDVVDRPQLVMRASDNRVQILEQQRWAEPLKAGIPRVVAANLGRLLGTPNITAYPKAEAAQVAYRVGLDVQRFESRPGDGITLEIGWTVRGKTAAAVRTGRTAVTEAAAGGDYEALVAAHSRALERVSREIAEAIRGFP